MGYTDGARHILVAAETDQIIHLSLGFHHAQFSIIIHHGHASTVIPTVFQPAQSLDEDGKRLFVTDISYYSTHV